MQLIMKPWKASRSARRDSSRFWRSEIESRFRSPSRRDQTTSLTQRNTPFALVTISLTNAVACSGFDTASCSIFLFASSGPRTQFRILAYVRSCKRSPTPFSKASSKTSQGRLETHTLTCGDEATSFRRSAIASQSPSYLSRPSMNKHSLNRSVASLIKSEKAFSSLLKDQDSL